MKRLSCFIITLLIVLSSCVYAYGSDYGINVNLDENSISENESVKYGISIDGIKSSNLIENGSFEDSDNGWIIPTTEYIYGKNDSMNDNNKTYNVITVDKKYTLKNKCYNGASFIKGETYEFSFFARNIDFNGAICVWLDGERNKNEVTQLSTSGISNSSWTRFTAELTAVETEIGEFAIEFEGTGSIEIDFVSLVPQNSYGYQNDAWKDFGIRQDVFNALQNIKPAFVQFSVSNWKNTIGSAYERKNSELGCHEYLQLCRDLNTVAIPTVNANKYKANSNKFTNYKQDVLDLIEYANANWATSYYGSLRSANGSQEPFNLKYIRIIGDDSRFDEIKNAINKKYKNITVLAENDIAVINSKDVNMGTTLQNMSDAIKNTGFVMLDDFFENAVMLTSSTVSYSSNYYAQMLLANNQGSKTLDLGISTADGLIIGEATIDQSKNSVFVSVVNSGSSTKAIINTDKLDGVTSASIQYINDGYLSSHNSVDKQYIAPIQKELEIDDGYIEVKIPENSVSVVRITYNNANDDVLFSIPNSINIKAKNYVPPVFIAIIVSLAVAIPIGSVIGFMLYKKVISKKTKEKENE